LLFCFGSQYFNTAERRIFDVLVEDKIAADNLDVFASTGAMNKAYVVETVATCKDKSISVKLVNVVENPMLSAVEVLYKGPPSPEPEQPKCSVPKVRDSPADLFAVARVDTKRTNTHHTFSMFIHSAS